MPPKVKISKDDIIRAALELVREGGENALNARSIVSSLNCSTQPIFSNFTTMEQLRDEVIKSAYTLYSSILTRKLKEENTPSTSRLA